MKKKISRKLNLGKRSVATLSDEAMNILNGGGYTSAGCGSSPFQGPSGTVMCPIPTTACITFHGGFTCN
jgi:natural product precursor